MPGVRLHGTHIHPHPAVCLSGAPFRPAGGGGDRPGRPGPDAGAVGCGAGAGLHRLGSRPAAAAEGDAQPLALQVGRYSGASGPVQPPWVLTNATCTCTPLYRPQRAVVLRPHHFQHRHPSFILEPAPEGGDGAFTCWVVPQHLQARHWSDLLRSRHLTDQLVLHESDVTQVLSKFEHPDFIHTHLATIGSAGRACMRYELPRFGLSFELSQGALVSLNYRGYHLAAQQQLVSDRQYTLLDFEQYLVLERPPSGRGEVQISMGARRAQQLVLIPAGSVEAQRQVEAGPRGLVHVSHDRCGWGRATGVERS